MSRIQLKSVFVLAVFITAVGCDSSDEREVISLIRIENSGPDAVSDHPRMNAQEYDISVRTQSTLIKSPFILNAAMREPGIAALDIFANVEHPVAWLEKNLQVVRPSKGEIISVMLRSDHTESARKVVDAVVNAYLTEVAQEQLSNLTRQLETLRKEYRENEQRIKEEAEIVQNLSREIDDPMSKEIAHRKLTILENELESVSEELLHLRLEQVVASPDDAPNLTKKVDLLTDAKEKLVVRHDEVCKSLLDANGSSGELIAGKIEMETLMELNSNIVRQIAQCELALQRKLRIQRVQPATLVGG